MIESNIIKVVEVIFASVEGELTFYVKNQHQNQPLNHIARNKPQQSLEVSVASAIGKAIMHQCAVRKIQW